MSGEPWKRYAPPGRDVTAAELEHGDVSEAEGWRRYNAAIEEVRELIVSSPLTNHDAQTRAEALAILPQIQAQAYLMVVAPRPDFPRFYRHEYFNPSVFSWNLPNPDFHYLTTFLDGRRSYRITGTRGACSWVNFQSFNCFNGIGTAAPRALGSWDLENFAVDHDDAFEIALSAAPQADNWIALDPASRNNWLLVRQLAYERETPPVMRIDTIGEGPPRRMVLEEGELGRRLALAGEMVKYVVTRMTYARVQEVVLKDVGVNAFHSVVGKDAKDAKDGTNPLAVYQIGVYEMAADEALVIEVDPPDARYWSVQLGDILNQTRDFVFHSTHLNDRSAVRDADGRVRIVLCSGDPGAPNWLDAMGSVYGRVVWRWYGADRVAMPTMRRVKRADLPAPLVSPAQRTAELDRRRWFYGGLYGF